MCNHVVVILHFQFWVFNIHFDFDSEVPNNNDEQEQKIGSLHL